MSGAVDVERYAPRFGVLVDGRELPVEAAHMVRGVEVTHELNRAGAFAIEVQDQYVDGRFRWLDGGRGGQGPFDIGKHVSIALGYAGPLETVCDGVVQRIEASFSEGLAPFFAVGGSDTAFDAMNEPRGSETFRDLSDSDIVARIAAAAGLRAETDPTRPAHPAKTKQSGQSYLQFLHDLAKDNDFEFGFAGRSLVFVEPKRAERPQVTLTWGRDLLSFQPCIDTSRQVTEVVVRAWDPVERRLIEERAGAGEEPPQEPGRRFGSVVARDRKRPATRVISSVPVRSPLEAQRIARSELARASDRLVTASGETVGHLRLKPSMCVEIQGTGAWFSGKYRVTKVTHAVDERGYRSRFEARRNAL